MSERLTPTEVLDALVSIAATAAEQYDSQLRTLPADAKTERKALTIQREMATLYIRAVLPEYGKTPIDALHAFMDRRLRQVTETDFPDILETYEAASAEDRRLLAPFLLGLTFCKSQFTGPWMKEFLKAQEVGDVTAAFELKLKINTVTRVLCEGIRWWEAHPDTLPQILLLEDMLSAF